MSNANIFARIKNLLVGFVSLFVGGIEEENPEIAYENSINGMISKYEGLKRATSAIVRRREEILSRQASAKAMLDDVSGKLNSAVATNQDDLAVILIQKKNALVTELASLEGEAAQAVKEADDAKESLMEVQSKIGELKSEKDSMLAKMRSSEARIRIQDTLSGFSVDAEVQALDRVRNHIKNKVAEANLGAELHNSDLDVRMKKLSATAAPLAAKDELARLKAARQTQAVGGGSAKQM